MQSVNQYRRTKDQLVERLKSYSDGSEVKLQSQDRQGTSYPRNESASAGSGIRAEDDESDDKSDAVSDTAFPPTDSNNAMTLRQILTEIESTHTAGEGSQEKSEELYIVRFRGTDDPMDPHNWSHSRKWLYTGIVGATGFLVSGSSAFDSEIVPQAMREYNVNQEVALLSTSLYMISLGLGTLISAPLSETVGRSPVYIVSLTLFSLFTIGSALAPNIQTQLVCRFFMGLFGSPPLVTFGGSMSDMWEPLERTFVFPILACLTFLGPFLAPMVADFVATSPYVSWHWVEWITLTIAGAILAFIFFVVPETYSPVILGWKAKHLRKITGDHRYRTPSDLGQENFRHRLLTSISRPVKFLFTEPIVDLFALYLVIVYIILFGFLPGFDFIFGEGGIYNFDQQHTGLCFIPMNVGFLLALVPVVPIFKRYKRKMREIRDAESGHVAPEERLVFSMLGAPLVPISIFWMGWTAWPSVSYWSPLVASGMFGFATMCIFISCYQYIIDSYEGYAASALVGMTVTRYLAAAPMVIVSVPMYANLDPHWALTLLGCLALIMTPVPYIFYRYGPLIREKSKSAA